MKPAAFEYFRPQTVEEAVSLMSRFGESAKVIAGGQSLVPMMNFRLARPGVLIDINSIGGLDYIRPEGKEIRIGALARHAELRESAVVREACPLMSDAYQHVAHGTVRNRGTLCGNLCHADPASEMPAVALACGAIMVLRGPAGERLVPAADFFQGLYFTALASDELLVEVRVPVASSSSGHSFQEVSVRKGDFALSLVAAVLEMAGQRVESAALVVGAVSDRALRLGSLEKRLVGQVPSAELFMEVGEEAAALLDPSEDVHASREYRRDLVRTLTSRALTEAAARAQSTTRNEKR